MGFIAAGRIIWAEQYQVPPSRAYKTYRSVLVPGQERKDGHRLVIDKERYHDVLRKVHRDTAERMTDNQLRQAWLMQVGGHCTRP